MDGVHMKEKVALIPQVLFLILVFDPFLSLHHPAPS